jgi:hypothetical protein
MTPIDTDTEPTDADPDHRVWEVGQVQLEENPAAFAIVSVDLKTGYPFVTLDVDGPSALIKLLLTDEEAVELGRLLTVAGTWIGPPTDGAPS